MRKETITYEDYNGNTHTEDYYFNIRKAELPELELALPGGLSKYIEDATKENDSSKIIEVIKLFIAKAIGEKSEDGLHHYKSEQYTKDFMASEAYSELFMKLASDEEYAANFIADIIPKDAADKFKATKKEAKKLTVEK